MTLEVSTRLPSIYPVFVTSRSRRRKIHGTIRGKRRERKRGKKKEEETQRLLSARRREREREPSHLSPHLRAELAFSRLRTRSPLQGFSIIPRLGYQSSIDCARRARRPAIALELVLARVDLLARGSTAGRCIKRFIFTRIAGSRASWHNASGHSRTFSTPTRRNHRAGVCKHIEGRLSRSLPALCSVRAVRSLARARAYCISLINVHIASPFTAIFRGPAYLLSIRSRRRNVSSNAHCFLPEPRSYLILSPGRPPTKLAALGD